MTKLLYKKKTKEDFSRKPFGNKSIFLTQAKQKMMQELVTETNMEKNELTKE
jgi:hypothetical protein